LVIWIMNANVDIVRLIYEFIFFDRGLIYEFEYEFEYELLIIVYVNFSGIYYCIFINKISNSV
jgi:hypothetical protein